MLRKPGIGTEIIIIVQATAMVAMTDRGTMADHMRRGAMEPSRVFGATARGTTTADMH